MRAGQQIFRCYAEACQGSEDVKHPHPLLTVVVEEQVHIDQLLVLCGNRRFPLGIISNHFASSIFYIVFLVYCFVFL